MADDKIVHRVSLEGAEDVANKLKKIGDVSSDAFKKVKQYSEQRAESRIAGKWRPRQSRHFAAMSEYFIDPAPACGVPNAFRLLPR
jgi:hypothetical protein